MSLNRYILIIVLSMSFYAASFASSKAYAQGISITGLPHASNTLPTDAFIFQRQGSTRDNFIFAAELLGTGNALPNTIWGTDSTGVPLWLAPALDVSAYMPGDGTVLFTVTGIQNIVVSPTIPTGGQFMEYSTGLHAWFPATLSVSDSQLANAYSGAGTCTSQVVTALTRNAPPTCSSISPAMISSMTSSALAGIISDETGTGVVVYSISPVLTTPMLTTPSISGASLITAIVAPSTPSAGIGSVYVDSTSKALAVKTDAGTVSHTVQSKSAVASNFLTGLSDAGVLSTAQPSFSDLTGSQTCAQTPALTGDISTSAGSCATTFGTSKTITTPVINKPTIGIAGTAGSSHIKTVGTAPTVSCTGTGTGGTAAMSNNSTDLSGTIGMTAGTLAGSTGTCTLTFNGTYTNNANCILTLVSASGTWQQTSTVQVSANSPTAPQITWWNNNNSVLTPLTSTQVYNINYLCTEH